MPQDQETPAAVEAVEAELQARLMARPYHRDAGMPRPLLPRVACADGFTVSVQANQGNYCIPREDVGPWSSVELGFPSAPMPELAEYCEDSENAATVTRTVWAYVPLHKAAAVLASHGGLVPASTHEAQL